MSTKRLFLASSTIGKALQMSDVDDALASIMTVRGIESGDVAAQVFSGFDWTAASRTERAAAVTRWLNAEEMYK